MKLILFSSIVLNRKYSQQTNLNKTKLYAIKLNDITLFL